MKRWDWMPWSQFSECWVLSQFFHSPLSPSRGSLAPLCFLPLKWFHLHVCGHWYFLPAILTPTCESSSTAFPMMYTAHNLNNQVDNIQLWHTSFPILNQPIVLCPVVTVASWPVYRFLRSKVRWSGIPISLRIFHSLFYSQKDFSIINEAEIDIFTVIPLLSVTHCILAIWSLVLPFL